MHINITQFFQTANPFELSGSVAEYGQNAEKITWQNALAHAGANPAMLDTEEKLEAFRDHVRGFGAWDDSEIEAWTSQECEALFCQLIAGDMREAGLEYPMSNHDWEQYEADSAKGVCPSNIFRGDVGPEGEYEVFYYLGM